MKSIAFKVGTTLTADVRYTPTPGSPADLSAYTITSQVKKGNTLVAELVVLKDVDNMGFSLSAPLGTSSWPVGQLLCDLRLEEFGNVFYSETFELNTSKPVTVPVVVTP